MKKIITLLSTLLILCSTVVCAADIIVEPTIDYDNRTIKVKFITEAEYNQMLSVVLYKGNKMGSDLSKFVKIVELTANEEGIANTEMKLSDDIPSGDYVISVYGGGIADNKGSKVIVYKDKYDQETIIGLINDVTIDTIGTEMTKYPELFGTTDSGVYEEFISIRENDFESEFTSLNDIVDSLEKAKLLNDINDIIYRDKLLSYLTQNANALGIDVKDSDFTSSKNAFADIFLNMKKEEALNGYNAFKQMYGQALAIAVINKTDVKTMTSVIKKYADVIGISKEEYEENISKYTDIEINKAFHGKGFEKCSEIVEAYNARINDLANEDTGSSGSDNKTSNKSSSSSSSSSVSVYVDKTVKEEVFTDFYDLAEAAWAEEAIKNLAKKGIVNGYVDKTFKPNNTVTREEFVTIIVRAFSVYEEGAKCKFKDVSETDWSYNYIASAAKKKYISGFEDGTFGKNSCITRQDAATILYRVGNSKGEQFVTDEVEFADSENIADYSKEAIFALSNAGVINGFGDGSFKPGESLTRAQAVKMIESLLNL